VKKRKIEIKTDVSIIRLTIVETILAYKTQISREFTHEENLALLHTIKTIINALPESKEK